MRPADAQIQHLKLRTRQADSPGLRLSIERQLGGVDCRWLGAPPSGILLVRALTDPLPGRISASPTAFRVDPDWERALRVQLESLRQEAARPGDGIIDASSGAIWFEDESELIACLILCESTGVERPWWWAAAAHYRPADSLAEWPEEHLPWLPAIFTRLVRWKQAEALAERIPPAVAAALVVRLAEVFELPKVLREATQWTGELSSRPEGMPSPPPAEDLDARLASTGQGSAPPTRQAVPANDGFGQNGRSPPPWRSWWRPDSTARLKPIQTLLLGLATGMHHSPAHLRGDGFERELMAWLADLGITHPTFPDSNARRAPSVGISEGSSSASAPSGGDGSGDIWQLEIGPGLPQYPPTTDRSRSRRLEFQLPLDGQAGWIEHFGDQESHPAAVEPEIPLPLRRFEQDAAASGINAKTGGAMPEDSSDSLGMVSSDRLEWNEAGLPTQLGGIVLLFNLLEFLDLPDCFEESCRLASAAGDVAVLETLALSLLDGIQPERKNDPVWALLAKLDGRKPGQPPLAEGMSDRDLRLPVAWFAGLGGDARPLRWHASDDRLALWSEAGFPVADLVLDPDDPGRQALAEASAYLPELNRPALDSLEPAPGLTVPATLTARHWPPPLARWGAFVMPFLRHRLAKALGHNTADPHWLLEEFLLTPGVIYLTDTHIDLVMAMDSIRLPVRLAGLDRSPGWLPRLGRVVLFHFE